MPSQYNRALLARLLASPPASIDECWPWPGPLSPEGYGRVSNQYVHRLSYEHFVAPIPDGLVLDHLCRNRACFNYTHLEPVTEGENTLRGEGMSARRARATTCERGHPKTAENSYLRPDGKGRQCLPCIRLRSSADDEQGQVRRQERNARRRAFRRVQVEAGAIMPVGWGRAAYRIGIPTSEYAAHRQAGERWCSDGAHWVPESTTDGSSCRPCLRDRVRQR
jgi:hypothetical protein